MSEPTLFSGREKNVGGYDRLARVVVGLVFAGFAIVAFTAGAVLIGALSLVVATGLFVNAATQFCGINAVLGIDTCSANADGKCQKN